ncbi:deoxycytidylate deaminase-like [Tachysurus ichikawai]
MIYNPTALHPDQDEFRITRVGACIVNQENKIVGIGYNGMPNGCDDDLLPWARSADDRLDTKYPYGQFPYITADY